MIAATLDELVELLGGVDGDQLVVDAARVFIERTVPEQITDLPAVVLQPADSFLAEDPTDQVGPELVISWEVILLVDLDDGNDVAANELYALLDAVLDRFVDSGTWWVERVGRPGPMQTALWTFHGVALTAQRRVTARF